MIFEHVPSIPLDRHPTLYTFDNFDFWPHNGDFQIFRPHVQGVKNHLLLNSKFSQAFIHKTAPKMPGNINSFKFWVIRVYQSPPYVWSIELLVFHSSLMILLCWIFQVLKIIGNPPISFLQELWASLPRSCKLVQGEGVLVLILILLHHHTLSPFNYLQRSQDF